MRFTVSACLLTFVVAGCSATPTTTPLPVRYVSGTELDREFTILWDVSLHDSAVDVVNRATDISTANSRLLHGRLVFQNPPKVVAVSGARPWNVSDLCAAGGDGESPYAPFNDAVIFPVDRTEVWVAVPPGNTEWCAIGVGLRALVVDDDRYLSLPLDVHGTGNELGENLRVRLTGCQRSGDTLRVAGEFECADDRQVRSWPSDPPGVRTPFVLRAEFSPGKGHSVTPAISFDRPRATQRGMIVVPFVASAKWDESHDLPMLGLSVAVAGHMDVLMQEVRLGPGSHQPK